MKPLIILDLDETLIYTTSDQLNSCQLLTSFISGLNIFNVYKRPYLDRFLDFIYTYFRVAFWTAGSDTYAYLIVPCLVKDRNYEFVYTNRQTTFQQTFHGIYTIKDLDRVNCNRERTLIIDNKAETFSRNIENGIKVNDFIGNPHDNELLILEKYLRSLLIDSRPWDLSPKNLKSMR